ncbi:response regulator [Ferrimicrobium sp.]|uniref:response regulator n=1 Tax=Ferrimicrobium sp. TaxID=2926050 RepID=UPI00260E35E2|nr:hypothetical protein [Ferrimicrobium sp.]
MTLNVLLIDDDPESLKLLVDTLPETIAGETIRWEPCGSFEKALCLIEERRFDIVVTDVYRDQKGVDKGPVTGDPRGTGLLEELRSRRFCPILFITDGTFPPDYMEGPFLKLADKSVDAEIHAKMEELIKTGIPELAHQLHDELDSTSGSYLWTFLDDNWAAMEASGLTDPEVLDRLLHRRASIQLSRLNGSGGTPSERQTIEGAEFYLMPRIALGPRLGEIVRRDGEFRVVLAPHCHLAIQPNKVEPRAEFVLTALTVPWTTVFEEHPLMGNTTKKLDALRRRLQSPSDLGAGLQGRYWFLPGFLDMDHQFVDFLQLTSLPYGELSEEWTPFAVLDVPFAEAFQSCFINFYSAVGLPVLDPTRFSDMIRDQ